MDGWHRDEGPARREESVFSADARARSVGVHAGLPHWCWAGTRPPADRSFRLARRKRCGGAGIQHQVWPLVLLPLVVAYVNWVVIPVEEARLQEVFQGAYGDYRTKVRRWI